MQTSASQARVTAVKRPHQITLVQQQQHVLVLGIPLEVVFQVLAPGAKRIPGIQYLHSKDVLPMQKLPKVCFVHQSFQLLCYPHSNDRKGRRCDRTEAHCKRTHLNDNI